MRIDNEIRKCVAFVGLQMADETYRYVGTVFWIGNDKIPRQPIYLVTARHVIDGIRSLGLDKVHLRVNLTNGTSTWYPTNLRDWFSHPVDDSIDVAVHPDLLPPGLDHQVFPMSECVTPELLAEKEVGVGDEVFIVGLFRHHKGEAKNIPIVRMGNLATLGEERIEVPKFGKIDAHLIEARSIGGLSGSPVFLNFAPLKYPSGMVMPGHARKHYLYGLVHGHFDSPSADIDALDVDDNSVNAEKVNTGIAMVIPFHSIERVITEFEAARRT